MAGRVEGKVCVITGAAGAIGLASAQRLAAEGGRVALADLATDGVERGAADIVAAGGDAAAFTVDVTDSDSVEQLYRDAHARFGRIDVCFNNAGVLLAGDGDPVETPLDLWLKVLAINQTGVFLCLKHQLPYLLEGGGGSIINTASMVALQGSATPQIAYDATKGAVVTISRDVAVTYGRRGIRCNALCPGRSRRRCSARSSARIRKVSRGVSSTTRWGASARRRRSRTRSSTSRATSRRGRAARRSWSTARSRTRTRPPRTDVWAAEARAPNRSA